VFLQRLPGRFSVRKLARIVTRWAARNQNPGNFGGIPFAPFSWINHERFVSAGS
jgi:hypothetical protein